jgi:RNA polymerase sigma-70 factor, ECF subfamily
VPADVLDIPRSFTEAAAPPLRGPVHGRGRGELMVEAERPSVSRRTTSSMRARSDVVTSVPDVDGDTALDDTTLAVLAKSDPEAFGLLYDRYCEAIYRFVYRRLRDREAAEDVTGEVFFKALRAIGGYRPSVAPFSAWLYRIAANAVTDHLRARRPSQPLDDAADAPDVSVPVDVQAINRVQADHVWMAVDRLSEAQRTAVTLRLGHDLPIAQIAVLMDRSSGAVKLLLNRGLTALRAHLAEQPPAAAGRRQGRSHAREIL